MVLPVDKRELVGSTVHAKAIHVMANAKCNRINFSHKKVNIDEDVIDKFDQQITKKKWKQF